MPKKEGEDEVLIIARAAADADPLAVFNQLVELREQGIDPVEAGIMPSNPITRKVKSADRWSAQQIDNAVKASGDWLDGIKNPSRDPIESAVAAEEKWKDRLTAAIKTGKWVKNLKKSSLSEIIRIAEEVGTGTYETGVKARKIKVDRVVRELQPLVQSASDTIQAMSDKTDSDREKRLLTARKLMIAVGEKRAGP